MTACERNVRSSAHRLPLFSYLCICHFLFFGRIAAATLYRLGIYSWQLCPYPDAMEYLRIFMHFFGSFQPGGQIARKVRQTSNNCSYRGCGGQYSDLPARNYLQIRGKRRLRQAQNRKIGWSVRKNPYMTKPHRDGGRKINLMVVTSCQPTSENRIIDLKISAGGTA